MPDIDYDEIAKQSGAITKPQASTDYDAIAKEAGAIDTPKADALNLSGVHGTPVAPGMPTGVEGMGSPDPSKGLRLLPTVVPGVVDAFASFGMQMGTPFATAAVSLYSALAGSQTPLEDAEKLVNEAVYSPKSEVGKTLTTLAGLPFQAVDKTIDVVGDKVGWSTEQRIAVKTALFAALMAKAGNPPAGIEESPSAFHVERVAKEADSHYEKTQPYSERGKTGKAKDKLDITPFRRTIRVAPKLADTMSDHAASYGQGNRIVNSLMAKMFPDAYEHLPKYLTKYMSEDADGFVSVTVGETKLFKRKLSAKEHLLLRQAAIRNNLGRLLVKDRIVGVYQQSLRKVKIADETTADLSNRLASLKDQQRRLSSGTQAASAVNLLPDLEKNIADITDAINRSKADKKYYSEKAANILKSHDVAKYDKQVLSRMEDLTPEIQFWKTHVNGYLDDLMKESKGLGEGEFLDTDNTGYRTGARVNLVHIDAKSPEWEGGHVVKNKADSARKEGVLSDTGKSVTKDPWDREAKATGTYTTSLYGMMRPVISKRHQSVTKLRFYSQLEESGMGKLVSAGEGKPAEIDGRPLVNVGPVEFPETIDGKTKTVLKHLYVGEDIAPEVKQLFLDDKAVSEVPLARKLTGLQLAQLAVDAVTHATNIFTQINKFWTDETTRTTTKVPLASPVMATKRYFETAKQVFDNKPETIERLRSMGEHGLLRDGYHVSWVSEKIAQVTGHPGVIQWAPGQILLKLDTASRMMLDDHFKYLVDHKKIEGTPTERRNMVAQVGNYNARMMEKWMADLRRSGIAPFVVAGSTYNRNALRYITGHPGYETSGMSFGDTIKARSEHLVKPIIFGLTIPAIWNMATTGHPLGRPGTPPGHLDLGGEKDENGKHVTFNLMIGTPFDRFMQESGGQAVWEGVRSGKTAPQIAEQAILDAARAQKHVVWGPGMEALAVAATGRDTDFSGRPHIRPKPTLSGKAIERGRATLEVTNPQLHAAITGEPAPGKIGAFASDNENSPVGKRLLNVLDLAVRAPKKALGISESHSARSAAEQEMVDRRAYLNDAPEAETVEARRILKKGIHMAKTNEAEAISYLYDKLDKGKITEDQFSRAWGEKDTSQFAKNFKRMGVKKTTTDKGSYAALYVWKLMNESERAQTAEIFTDKIQRAWNAANATEQRELLSEWHKILPDLFGEAQ